jgi:hypothetical protein
MGVQSPSTLATHVYDPLQPHWFAKTEYEGVTNVPL